MKRRTISRLAKEAGVGVETIRFYERCGVLKQPATPPTGWREYSAEALSTVRYIKLGQQMGFKLSDIQSLQQAASGGQPAFCESVRAATREKIVAVEKQIAALRKTRQELRDFLRRCSAKKPSEPCPLYNTLGSMKFGDKRR